MAMSALRLSDAELIELADAIEGSPTFFVREILGQDPWEMPRRIMAAIARPRARVAVKACHSSAKTHTAAGLTLWWTANGGIVITTAPTWPQVKTLLWREVAAAYERSRFRLGGKLNTVEWQVGPQQYAIGLSTNEGVNFQGFHGKVLIVLDEAPGVRPDIFEAIEGIRAGGDVRVLMLGNPTIASGPFYEAFGRERRTWQTSPSTPSPRPTSAGVEHRRLARHPAGRTDHPLLNQNPRPYLTTRRWVHEKLHTWTEDSPLWQSRVRGQFPQAVGGRAALAGLAGGGRTARDRGHRCGRVGGGHRRGRAGRGRDGAAVRRGPTLVREARGRSPDPRGEVLAALAPFKDKLRRVKVDSIGQGYYFARHIEDNGYQGRSRMSTWARRRATREVRQLQGRTLLGAADAPQAGDLAGLADETTVGQLAGIRYRHDAQRGGHVVIESQGRRQQARHPQPRPRRGDHAVLRAASWPAPTPT
jgi:phage terminase large subunit